MPVPMTLLLFGEPRLAYGETGGSFTDREIPEGGKRLIAYAALHRGRLDRRHAAGTLRPACDEVRAAGNFRSALWRLRAAGVVVLEADKRRIRLHPRGPAPRTGRRPPAGRRRASAGQRTPAARRGHPIG